ncbi:hypothetical protein PAECIP111893_00435 [Paenibacillus plantiphilus]|uniref:FAD dependent oxidoreductase domain-containing protein n=1 Tax=Paenibacillus plantiphilus TaxID=2905650 RepID=A0ABM9BS35_9BACL|nr:FAD-dependent oxidoreductase [Paenibacillus plantiphilus]CAH1193329.1 hypothetical protein PAECIP111893_00435 [Paenibacillus plantiphilus]
MMRRYDAVIIGAGIFGMYAAKLLGDQGKRVIILEADDKPIQRASFINQARVHNGYHYPRSVSTAAKSALYYERFSRDFDFAIHSKFKKIYAIAQYDSLTNAEQFQRFCEHVKIPSEEVNPNAYFNKGMVEAAFETLEYTYDASLMREWFLEKFRDMNNIDIKYHSRIKKVVEDCDAYEVELISGERITSSTVLNATYASINQILNTFGYEAFKTKFELCEVILTSAGDNLRNVGITLMDGPFFSIMPFGKTGYHSLTSVSYTPHESVSQDTPVFSCQSSRIDCTSDHLQNCNHCSEKPQSNWYRMNQLANKFLNPDIEFRYESSLYAVKTVLHAAEIDDSRPTVFRKSSQKPLFLSVLSGKFNTIYDLEEMLL